MRNANDVDKLDALFSSNDALALGARAAMLRIKGERPTTKLPVIVGYDGTDAVKSLILDDRDSVISNDADVDVRGRDDGGVDCKCYCQRAQCCEARSGKPAVDY